MTSVNLLPLLERLAGESDELLRRSLLTAVTAMAQSGVPEEHLQTTVREAWAEKVTQIWCQSATPPHAKGLSIGEDEVKEGLWGIPGNGRTQAPAGT